MSRLIRPSSVGGSSLVRDYLQADPKALSFYSGFPFSLDSYRQKLEEVQRRFGPDQRAAAARSLRPTSDVARERLARFVEEGGAMVTTGQQAGFLTGPLYTVYKALSAAALARHLESELDTLVLPLFWVASEDHDWAEVNHAFLLDPRNKLHRIALESSDERALPMSVRQVEGTLEPLDALIAQVIGGTPDNARHLEGIVAPYRSPGTTVAGAFAEAMASLLGPFDFVMADAANPVLKEIARPVFRGALFDAEAQQRALEGRSRELSEAGYREQVTILDRGTNVFFQTDGERERLYRRGSDFGIRGDKEIVTTGEIARLLEEEPGRFSGNVLLRPVVESWAYPTLCYVGGPGEIAYFAQVGAVFETYGVMPPVVTPRFSGLVVEPKVERLLEGLGLSVEDTHERREVLLERLARAQTPDAVTAALAALRKAIAEGAEPVLAAAREIDESASRAVGAGRNRMLLEAGRMERGIVRAIKRSDRIEREKLDRVLDSLRPEGKPQDRVLNVLPYLARYGEHFLREVDQVIRESWRLPG